jgi:hypothetical protein
MRSSAPRRQEPSPASKSTRRSVRSSSLLVALDLASGHLPKILYRSVLDLHGIQIADAMRDARHGARRRPRQRLRNQRPQDGVLDRRHEVEIDPAQKLADGYMPSAKNGAHHKPAREAHRHNDPEEDAANHHQQQTTDDPVSVRWAAALSSHHETGRRRFICSANRHHPSIDAPLWAHPDRYPRRVRRCRPPTGRSVRPARGCPHCDTSLGRGLLNVIGRSDNHVGDVSGFAPPGDIHRVHNTAEETAISIHVYGTGVTRIGSSARRYYD